MPRRLELKMQSQGKFHTTVTFDLIVRLRLIIYQNTLNLKQKPKTIQMVITFDSVIWLRPIVYRDAQN